MGLVLSESRNILKWADDFFREFGGTGRRTHNCAVKSLLYASALGVGRGPVT